jgi:thiamine pyrophosphate-dependent acetolactate synthase large subunit-like protein
VIAKTGAELVRAFVDNYDVRIACGFGAKVLRRQTVDEVTAVMDAAWKHPGPTFVTINRVR